MRKVVHTMTIHSIFGFDSMRRKMFMEIVTFGFAMNFARVE
jgi:hypothetical protein